MKRRLLVVTLLLSGLGASAAAHSGVAHAYGSSGNAQLCNEGGYANVVGSNGMTDVQSFPNVWSCSAYAAQGGTLALRSAAAPCLNNGFVDEGTTTGTTSFAAHRQVGFPSEAACVLYVGQGGTLLSLSNHFSITANNVIMSAFDGTSGSISLSGFVTTSSNTIVGSGTYQGVSGASVGRSGTWNVLRGFAVFAVNDGGGAATHCSTAPYRATVLQITVHPSTGDPYTSILVFVDDFSIPSNEDYTHAAAILLSGTEYDVGLHSTANPPGSLGFSWHC